MNKAFKYGLWLVVLVLLAFKSVYFKKLSDVKKADAGMFKPDVYAQNFWKTKLPAAEAKAVDIDQLLATLKNNPHSAFQTYGHAIAIGSTRFFMVKGHGKVTDVTPDEVMLNTVSSAPVQLATTYVFGNAVRDASGMVQITEFSNTIDLSNVSGEIDKIIRKQVLPPFKQAVKKGDKVDFIGAIALNEAHLSLSDLEIIPVNLKLQK